MRRTTKYVALDVHQASTIASVRQETGRVICRTILPTEEPAIIEVFRGMRGAIHVAFEEGTQAQWLHDLLGKAAPGIPGNVARPRPTSSRDCLPRTRTLSIQRGRGPPLTIALIARLGQ